jgi:predicted RNA binding protein YcfA (HicA-like mRNA interferase family)
MSSREIVWRLERDGWRLARTKGSHRQYKHPEKTGLVTVPHPKRDIPPWDATKLFMQAWLDR